MNLDRLQEITLGQVELQRELLDSFIEVMRVNLETIKHAMDVNDCLTVSRCAHQMKGAAANIGVPSIKAIATELEHQAQQQNLVGAAELLVVLENQRSQVQALILDQLP